MIAPPGFRRSRPLLIARGGLLLVLLGACSPVRGQLALHVVPLVNPASGPSVRFERVTDARVFQAKANAARSSTPSLRGDEIDNADLTSRAVAWEDYSIAGPRAWRAALNKGLDELARQTRALAERR